MPQPTENPLAPTRRSHWLRALRHSNFRLFFIGQGVSLMGTWMQQTALAWLVFRLTEEPFLMGLNTFMGQIPSLVLMPLAGVLVDRWNRLPLVLVTQALSMVQAFILAGIVLFDLVDIWHLMALAFGLGCVNAFDMPARQALIPAMLEEPDDLSNAIALNSSLFNAARLVGPALAGQLARLGPAGEGYCFLLNALSFLAVLVALSTMRIARKPVVAKPAPVLDGLLEGMRFARRQPALLGVLLLVAALGFVAMPYTVVLPVIARDVLKGDVGTYSTLVTASGVGALAGAVYLAGRTSIRGAASRIAVSGVAGSLSLAIFSQCSSVPAALALIFFVSLCMMMTAVSCNTIVQTIVPDAMRGRILSMYNLAFMGLTPFGALIIGTVASHAGARRAALCCAAGCLLGTLSFLPFLKAVRSAIRAHLAGRPLDGTAAKEPKGSLADSGVIEELHHV
jgi:MFS family permease